MKRYDNFGCLNLRSVGGIPAEKGRYVVNNRFFRSDLPVKVEEADEAFIEQINLRTVIDLRSKEEIRNKTDVIEGREGICYFAVPLGGMILKEESCIPESYIEFTNNKEAVQSIFRYFLREGAVLYHCSAGKDRTGVISALLLWLAGAKDEDIIADYMVSGVYIRPILQQFREFSPDLPAFAGQSKAAYMEYFLAEMKKAYGNAQEYLLSAGLLADEVCGLKRKLLI